jgi:hypothetical protein
MYNYRLLSYPYRHLVQAQPPGYADNAAALAGGLSVGDLYRDTDTNAVAVVQAA